jgi:integrase
VLKNPLYTNSETNTNNINSTHHRIEALPKVKTFLDSIERNSLKTRDLYRLGLAIFQNFLDTSVITTTSTSTSTSLTIETILQPLAKNELDLYELLDKFVSYLMSLKQASNNNKLSVNSMKAYLTAVKSYLGYYDIDVIPSKFRRRVKMPKLYREDEEPLDAADIRKILLACNNRRLKSYLLVLASGGMRAIEALAIRLKDIDFSVTPTKIHIRKEFAKTRVARDIYISDEASQSLEQWIDWKYRDKGNEWTKTKNPNDLVFAVYSIENRPNPNHVYIRIMTEFEKLLTIAGMDERKEGMSRRKITLHSFRRHAKGVISNQVNQDYSEWYLGHSKSPYYTLKEPERLEIYATKVMRYLTFLDYSALESSSKNIEDKLLEREREIYALKQRDNMTTTTLSQLTEELLKFRSDFENWKKTHP